MPLTIYTKMSIIDVSLGRKYAFASHIEKTAVFLANFAKVWNINSFITKVLYRNSSGHITGMVSI